MFLKSFRTHPKTHDIVEDWNLQQLWCDNRNSCNINWFVSITDVVLFSLRSELNFLCSVLINISLQTVKEPSPIHRLSPLDSVWFNMLYMKY